MCENQAGGSWGAEQIRPMGSSEDTPGRGIGDGWWRIEGMHVVVDVDVHLMIGDILSYDWFTGMEQWETSFCHTQSYDEGSKRERVVCTICNAKRGGEDWGACWVCGRQHSPSSIMENSSTTLFLLSIRML